MGGRELWNGLQCTVSVQGAWRCTSGCVSTLNQLLQHSVLTVRRTMPPWRFSVRDIPYTHLQCPAGQVCKWKTFWSSDLVSIGVHPLMTYLYLRLFLLS